MEPPNRTCKVQEIFDEALLPETGPIVVGEGGQSEACKGTAGFMVGLQEARHYAVRFMNKIKMKSVPKRNVTVSVVFDVVRRSGLDKLVSDLKEMLEFTRLVDREPRAEDGKQDNDEQRDEVRRRAS